MPNKPGAWEPVSEIDKRFAEFDAACPEVWREFVRIARQQIRDGMEHFSADAILHHIRHFTRLGNRSGPGPRLNNDFTACYARKWVREFPRHAGFFRLRARRCDMVPSELRDRRSRGGRGRQQHAQHGAV